MTIGVSVDFNIQGSKTADQTEDLDAAEKFFKGVGVSWEDISGFKMKRVLPQRLRRRKLACAERKSGTVNGGELCSQPEIAHHMINRKRGAYVSHNR